MENVKLSNGVEMPYIGFGTARLAGDSGVDCILNALKAGYRSIDTAQFYGNEEEVGTAIKESGIPREEIFLTTKVWYTNNGYDKALSSVKDSLEKLQTDYLDLCLIHKPIGDYYAQWRALEDLYDEGLIRAIGVTTFNACQLLELDYYSRISPMINQVLTNPFNQQDEVRHCCDKLGIQMEAWSPFAQGNNDIWNNPILNVIAQKHGKSVAQVILRWDVQRNTIAIPKTTHEERMKENLEIFDFELDDDDMKAISTLNTQIGQADALDDPAFIEQLIEDAKDNRTTIFQMG